MVLTYTLSGGKVISATGNNPRETFTKILKQTSAKTINELESTGAKGHVEIPDSESELWTAADRVWPDDVLC